MRPNPSAQRLERPLRWAMLAQLLAAVGIAGLIWLTPGLLAYPWVLALIQGGGAATASWWLRMPRWWYWIGGLFVPLAYFGQGFELPPGLWLLGFALLLAIFWRTDASRVPLYMTNAATVAALAGLLPTKPCRFIDLGCGDGSLLRQLATSRPDCQLVGYEHAPLTWAWAKLLGLRHANLEIRLGSFWGHSLAEYDCIYAFLSPAPMPRLWRKAASEMKLGALLVSNSFPVPDVRPQREIAIADARQSVLYGYVPGETTVGGTT